MSTDSLEAERTTTALKTLDIQRIMKLIPHRYPFLLIDKVVELDPGKRAVGIKNVTINEPQFTGHFPARPIMPGVMIIEAMAQTSAALVAETLGGESEGKLVYFMSIENAKFRKPVVPGDTMSLVVVTQKSRGPVWKFDAEALVEGVRVAEATFSAMIMDGEV